MLSRHYAWAGLFRKWGVVSRREVDAGFTNNIRRRLLKLYEGVPTELVNDLEALVEEAIAFGVFYGASSDVDAKLPRCGLDGDVLQPGVVRLSDTALSNCDLEARFWIIERLPYLSANFEQVFAAYKDRAWYRSRSCPPPIVILHEIYRDVLARPCKPDDWCQEAWDRLVKDCRVEDAALLDYFKESLIG